jgi:PAS domain S-box-containing protein
MVDIGHTPVPPAHSDTATSLESLNIDAFVDSIVTHAVFLLDMDGLIRKVNGPALEYVGEESAKVVGKPYTSLFSYPAGDRISLRQVIEDSTTNKNARFTSICRYQSNTHTFENTISLLVSPAGIRAGYLILSSPIVVTPTSPPEFPSLRTTIEETLLGATFDQAAVGLVIVDMANFRFLKANHKLCEMLGYTETEFCQKTIPEVTHPDDVLGDIDNTHRMIMGEIEHFTMEKRLLCKDGSYLWTQLRPTSVTRDENGIAQYGLAVIEDISRIKKTEEALHESENRFKLLADTAPVLIFVMDTTPRNIYVNNAWLSFTGQDYSTALGENWYQVIHPDDQTFFLQSMAAANSAPEYFQSELQVKKANDEYGWLLITAAPRYTKSGLFLGYIGSGVDITSRKQAEDDLLKYQNRLEQSNRDLEHFASIASHDLQAPLRKITLFAQFLSEQEGEKLSLEGQDFLTRIHQSSQKMQTFVMDLLKLSRVTEEGITFSQIPLDAVVKSALAEISLTVRQTEATVVTESLPYIEADFRQLEQLFINLILNSIKFKQEDLLPIIGISATTTNDTCHITVCDNGIGFSKDKAERVFDIFERLHVNTQYTGTGIGLSIVKRIIERHSGTISVISEPDVGTSFLICLPLIQPKP